MPGTVAFGFKSKRATADRPREGERDSGGEGGEKARLQAQGERRSNAQTYDCYASWAWGGFARSPTLTMEDPSLKSFKILKVLKIFRI